MRIVGKNIFGRTGEDKTFLQLARHTGKVQDVIPDNIPFPCNVTEGRSSEVPDSVHKLRPGDIDVIGAMGDSLTAGAGAFGTNLFHVLVENRGISAAGGGQSTWRQYTTLPNILKEFNPNLTGYALGDSLALNEAAQLNVAESGAFSEDMPFMAEVLVTRIKKHPKIDLQKHWKFISIMIGTNDFCSDICWVQSPWSVLEKHKQKMLQVLRTLRDNLPRTFVALILPPHLKALVDSRKGRTDFLCFLTTQIECGCLFGFNFQKMKPIYYDIMKRWQQIDLELAASPEFQRDDFAVVAQTILLDVTIPLTPNGYMSTDCFHISQKGNAIYAYSLWNNLLEPVGTKMTMIMQSSTETFKCPTSERPYLATMQNSRK